MRPESLFKFSFIIRKKVKEELFYIIYIIIKKLIIFYIVLSYLYITTKKQPLCLDNDDSIIEMSDGFSFNINVLKFSSKSLTLLLFNSEQQKKKNVRIFACAR